MKMCCHILNWGCLKGNSHSNWQTVYLELWHNSDRDFLTLIVKSLLLLTSWNESRENKQTKKMHRFLLLRSRNIHKVAGTCFSSLFLNIQLDLLNKVTSNTKKVLLIWKDPSALFQRKNLTDFSNNVVFFEWIING